MVAMIVPSVIQLRLALLVMLCWIASTPASLAAERLPPLTCTYDVHAWNVALKRSVNGQRVKHPYSELSVEEIDPVTGCTVCSEDQELIEIPPLAPFSVCYKMAPQVWDVLTSLIRQGQPIFRVDGYRVIRSRGAVDWNGNRTGFSNHSYGTAIDINPDQNGLYDNCLRFGPECRLIRGGEWKPGTRGALEKEAPVVRALMGIGFRWGGEIEGKQKDFMHFSPTGY